MAVQIQLRRDTAANWVSADPTLAEGEIGVEIDTDLVKIGNGSDSWTALEYAFAPFTPAVSSSLSTTGTVNLDMAALNGTYQSITLTGDITFTTSNRAAGRTVTLRLIEPGTAARTLTLPAGWVFVGSSPPATLDDEVAILTVTFFGTNDTDAAASMATNEAVIGGITPQTRTINTSGTGLSGGGDLTADRTITLDPSALSADSAFTGAFAAKSATLRIVGQSVSGRVSLPNTTSHSRINAAYAASTLFFWPFVVTDPITITEWLAAFRTNTSASTETLRAGIYTLNSDLTLNALVSEFPTLTVPTGTGIYETVLSAPLDLGSGRYAIAWNTSATTFTLDGPRTPIEVWGTNLGGNINAARFLDGSQGGTNVANPLPATPVGTTSLALDGTVWGPAVGIYWSLT